MISTLMELRQAKMVLQDVQDELDDEGIEYRHSIPVGIMVEVPSVALMAASFAKEVHFLSIGTNDLIQYTLAVDRTDERVSDRYQPLHPAVLRLLREVRRAGARRGIPVAVCGEMASDPLLLRLLIGCGLTEFSMTPGALAVARRVVQQTSAKQMARVAAKVLTLGTVDEIEQFLHESFDSTGAHTEVPTTQG